MRCLLIGLALGAAVVGQDDPARTGSISGRVTVGEQDRPVRGAAVTASRADNLVGMAWSGENGYYHIEDLPPDRYVVSAFKPGLRDLVRQASVRQGEDASGVDLRMLAPTVAAGRVRDAEDLPVAGAAVSAVAARWRAGRRVFSQSSLGYPTDDRGEYRLRLNPLRPYLFVLWPPYPPDISGRYRLAHPPLFHPNALSPAETRPVQSDAGVELETLDFEVPPPADTVLRLNVATARFGEPHRACGGCPFAVFAPHEGAWVRVTARGRSNTRGRVEIRGLQAGAYRVGVATRIAATSFAGYQDVVVEDARMRSYDVVAHAVEKTTVQVRLVDPPEQLRSQDSRWELGVRATPLGSVYPIRVSGNTQPIRGGNTGGRGEVGLPPGASYLQIYPRDPLPRSAYIEEILVLGRPQPGPVVMTSPQGRTPPVLIRVGFAAANLSGMVSGGDADTFPPPAVRAIAQPADGYGLDRLIRVGENGEFATGESNALRPGTYLLYAISGNARHLDFSDPAVQSRYASYSKRIELEPGGNARVELEAIR